MVDVTTVAVEQFLRPALVGIHLAVRARAGGGAVFAEPVPAELFAEYPQLLPALDGFDVFGLPVRDISIAVVSTKGPIAEKPHELP